MLALTAILLLALNLRPTAVSVGPVLGAVSADLGLSATTAGLLTALPVLCFAVFGLLTPAVATRLGSHRTAALALLLVGVGQLVRVLAGGPTGFLAWSVVALAGMATGNVLLPSLVRRHFPGHVGRVTSIYSTVLMTGLTITSLGSAPLADWLGGWRPGLAVWGVLALVCLAAWLPLLRVDRDDRADQDSAPATRPRRARMLDIARTRTGCLMAIFFGVQSMQAYAIFGWLPSIYQGAGFSPAASGALLAVATGVGIVLALLFADWTARHPSPYGLMLVIGGCGFLGYLGLLLAPATLPWLWALLLAIGNGAFPPFLVLVGHRARTVETTASLSAFSQGVGYLLAAAGPFSVGWLHELTGGWQVPIMALMVLLVPMTALGLLICRPRTVDDELAPSDR